MTAREKELETALRAARSHFGDPRGGCHGCAVKSNWVPFPHGAGCPVPVIDAALGIKPKDGTCEHCGHNIANHYCGDYCSLCGCMKFRAKAEIKPCTGCGGRGASECGRCAGDGVDPGTPPKSKRK